MGGEVVGINTETFDGNKTAIKEAKTILEKQGAKYRNLSIDSSSDAGKYASDIMAFPTTILVDRNGNIVGDPMLGGIDNQDNYDTLMKQIQSVIDADSTKKNKNMQKAPCVFHRELFCCNETISFKIRCHNISAMTMDSLKFNFSASVLI